MLTSGTKRSRRNERFIQPRMKHDSEDHPHISQIAADSKKRRCEPTKHTEHAKFGWIRAVVSQTLGRSEPDWRIQHSTPHLSFFASFRACRAVVGRRRVLNGQFNPSKNDSEKPSQTTTAFVDRLQIATDCGEGSAYLCLIRVNPWLRITSARGTLGASVPAPYFFAASEFRKHWPGLRARLS